jgi:hypothetical protein
VNHLASAGDVVATLSTSKSQSIAVQVAVECDSMPCGCDLGSELRLCLNPFAD